jgi:hypothetical protein
LIIPILGVLISLSLVAIMTKERLIAAAIALVVGAVLWGIGRMFGRSETEQEIADSGRAS